MIHLEKTYKMYSPAWSLFGIVAGQVLCRELSNTRRVNRWRRSPVDSRKALGCPRWVFGRIISILCNLDPNLAARGSILATLPRAFGEIRHDRAWCNRQQFFSDFSDGSVYQDDQIPNRSKEILQDFLQE